MARQFLQLSNFDSPSSLLPPLPPFLISVCLNLLLSNLLGLQLFSFLSVFYANLLSPDFPSTGVFVLLFHFPPSTFLFPQLISSFLSIHLTILLSQLRSQLFPAYAPAFPWRGPSSLPRAPSIPSSRGQKADAAQHLLLPHRQREVMSRLSCSAQPQSLCVLSPRVCMCESLHLWIQHCCFLCECLWVLCIHCKDACGA